MNGILDLRRRLRLHVVGVGGPGMSAIATCLAQMGHEVSGSDIKSSELIERLVDLGIRVNIGHDSSVVHNCNAVTASTAIPRTNIELVEAEQSRVPVLNRAAMLASICAMSPSIGVAGTHGKTTTTSLLVRIFTEAGLDPNFVVGGELLDEGAGARWTGAEWNVTAAIALAVSCGIDPQVAVSAVAKFGGVGRRFEIIGEADGITFVDDYAHLPREIAAVMSAAKTSDDHWERVVAVFQPNRYNRMAVMSHEYINAFVDADVVVITDIYASGTQKIEGITGRLVVEAVLQAHPHAQVFWHAERDSLAEFVNQLVQPRDVCISMGCGDIEYLPQELVLLRSDGAAI
jgi:UDP-N-acetylmuramate-alanine ligase